MEKYIVENVGDKIIFKDVKNNLELAIKHYEEEYIFDIVFVDKRFTKDFVHFIAKTLKETNDFGSMYVKYDDIDLEKKLLESSIKVSNYQYLIKKDGLNYESNKEYEINAELTDKAQKYYLEKINEVAKINHEYYRPDDEFLGYSKKVFQLENFKFCTYLKNGKIVGMLDYQIMEDHENAMFLDEVFNTNNRVCIRSVLADNKEIMQDMLFSFIKKIKKDVIINVMYTEKELRSIIEKLNGEFMCTMYTLIK